ncbi:MAG: leucine-rich repeat domain-containing protein [Clostridia bacterium]|nr:leucine-rich repeat domain-containing protein [Clostridia bacterium]
MVDKANNSNVVNPNIDYKHSHHDFETIVINNDESEQVAEAEEVRYVPTEEVYSKGVITRAQWIHNLVSILDLTIAVDNMPDFYFSDAIDENNQYYNDILLAVGYGLIDIDAGGWLRPDDPLTREFAAQTLSYYVGNGTFKENEYTFDDIDDVEYKDEAQWSINNGLFLLSEGKFLPNAVVTESELSNLINCLNDYHLGNESNDQICEYVFADGVIEIPNGTNVYIAEDNEIWTITINGYSAQISQGDTIAVYVNSIAYTFIVDSVSNNAGSIVIQSSQKADGAILSANARGGFDIDIEEFEANTDPQYFNLKNGDVAKIEVKKLEFEDSKLTLDYDIVIGDGIKGKLKLVVKKLKFDYNVHTGNPFTLNDDNCYVTLSGNLKASCMMEFKVPELLGVLQEEDLKIGSVPIGAWGVGKIELALKVALSGQMALNYETKFKTGFRFKNGEFSVIKEFTDSSPSISGEAEASVMIELKLKFDALVFGGSIAVAFGPKLKLKIETFTDGLLPRECRSIEGYLALEVTPKAYIGIDPWKLTWDKKFKIFSKKNSPIRVCYHWEDGSQVFSCARENTEAEVTPSPNPGGGSGGNNNSGSGTGHSYITSPSSHWYSNGQPSVSSGVQDSAGNNVTLWEYDENGDGTITITGYSGNPAVLTVPSEIDGYAVTAIGDYAFENKISLRTVFICDGIEVIGEQAFEECTNLSSISFPESLLEIGMFAFMDCTSLESVELPEHLTFVDSWAFRGCSSLTSVDFPESLEEIGSYAFEGCSALTAIVLREGLVEMGGWVFRDCTNLRSVHIPTSLQNASWGVFENCSALANITFGEDMPAIIDNLFDGCTGLQNGIDLPETITEIGSMAFRDCTGLPSIAIPDTVTAIGSWAFDGCTNLANIEIPESVEIIDSWALSGCTSLTEVYLPEGLVELGSGSFGNCTNLHTLHIPSTLQTATFGPFENCSALVSITFGEGIESIAPYLFTGCTGLAQGIDLPETITLIGSGAFDGCTALPSILIPDGVVEIGGGAFYDCTNLESIELPDSLMSIGSGSFQKCSSLKTVKIPEGITVLEQYTFEGCSSL